MIEESTSSAEILVPPHKIWWTFLALSAERQFETIRILRGPSDSGHSLFVDAALISRLPQKLCRRTRVMVILWDGYQSYLECMEPINELARRVEQIEIRSVGDPSEWMARCRELNRFSLLFPQEEQLYRRQRLLPERVEAFSFPNAASKLAVTHRSNLISGKVALQLLLGRRLKEYGQTKYVFCGQTGLGTLSKYHAAFCPNVPMSDYPNGGLSCDHAFIISWISSILRNREHWATRVVARAMLRLMALRTLFRSMGKDIFLNIYPATNLNAYQAGMLFRKHIFLEFGGVNGDESIYPRTADLAFHGRQMIRFDTRAAVDRLMQLEHGDVAGLSLFAESYSQQVLTNMDQYASMDHPTVQPHETFDWAHDFTRDNRK